MKKYILTSKMLDGSMEFTYNERGYLVSYNNQSNWDEAQQAFLVAIFPTTIGKLEELGKMMKGGKVQETNIILTFEMFYEKYGNKVGRKEAENKWKRMSAGERLMAYNYIPAYKGVVQTKGIALKYPATYLNSEPWRD